MNKTVGQIGAQILIQGGIAISLAIAGYAAAAQNALATRVDALSTQQAATAQQAKDIDVRLTRIENKLDAALQKQ